MQFSNGVTASFSNTSGHTYNDRWDWTVNQDFDDVLVIKGGNVSIGQSIASEKLEVDGNVKATAFIGDGSQLTGINTAWENNGTAIYYDGANNVGVGTSSPEHKLDIKLGTHVSSGDTVVAKSYVLHGAGISGYDANLTSFLGHGETNSWSGTANIIGIHGLGENSQSGGGHNNSTVIGLKGEGIGSTDGVSSTAIGGYFTAFGGHNNYAGIFENGNVGIGNTNPSEKLEVDGNIKATAFIGEVHSLLE